MPAARLPEDDDKVFLSVTRLAEDDVEDVLPVSSLVRDDDEDALPVSSLVRDDDEDALAVAGLAGDDDEDAMAVTPGLLTKEASGVKSPHGNRTLSNLRVYLHTASRNARSKHMLWERHKGPGLYSYGINS